MMQMGSVKRKQFPDNKFYDSSPIIHSPKANTIPKIPKTIPEMLGMDKCPPDEDKEIYSNLESESSRDNKQKSSPRYIVPTLEQEKAQMIKMNQELDILKMAQREEREKHKNYLAEEYKQQITNANKKSHIHKESEKERDLYRLKMIEKQVQLDRSNKEQLRHEQKEEQLKLLKERENKNMSVQQMKEIERQAYVKDCMISNEMQLRSQKEFQKRFADYPGNLYKRQDIHRMQVLEPSKEKNEIMRQWEDKRIAKYNEKLTNELELIRDFHNQQAKKISIENKKVIDAKNRENSEFKRGYLDRAEENKKIAISNENRSQLEREETLRRKMEYRRILQSQFKDQRNKSLVHNRSLDDQSFGGMIPGISNIPSVGTRPILRMGKEIMNQKIHSSGQAQFFRVDTGGESHPLPAIGAASIPLAVGPLSLGGSSQQPTPRSNRRSESGELIGRNPHSPIAAGAGGFRVNRNPNKSFQYPYGSTVAYSNYNTITNPIPNVRQNPYINKEMYNLAHPQY